MTCSVVTWKDCHREEKMCSGVKMYPIKSGRNSKKVKRKVKAVRRAERFPFFSHSIRMGRISIRFQFNSCYKCVTVQGERRGLGRGLGRTLLSRYSHILDV